MISDATISSQGGRLVIKERPSIESKWVEPLLGLFPLGIGCLTLYVFFPGHGLGPITGSIGMHIRAWLAIALFAGALGVLPLAWGLSILFVRRNYIIWPADGMLESHVTFAGAPVRIRRHAAAEFERVDVRRGEFGRFATHYRFIVFCGGKQGLDISAFDSPADAALFAAGVAEPLKLPVMIAEPDKIKPPGPMSKSAIISGLIAFTVIPGFIVTMCVINIVQSGGGILNVLFSGAGAVFGSIIGATCVSGLISEFRKQRKKVRAK